MNRLPQSDFPNIDADALAARVRGELSASSQPPPSDTGAPEASRERPPPERSPSTPGKIADTPNPPATRGLAQWAAGVRRRTIERLLHDTFARIELWQMRAELNELRAHSRAFAEQIELLCRQLVEARAEKRQERADNDRRIKMLEADLGYQQRRLAKLADGSSLPEPATAGREGPFDSLHVALDEELLGSPAQAKERLLPVLERFRQLRASDPGRPVLDIACGRGDWLELLGQVAISAYGIEPNKHAVERCTKVGLDVRHADVLDYLTALPEKALGAITALHLIERLSIGELVRLLEEARRILIPGGVLLLGSPNPETLTVGASTYYEDPTRHRPIPAKLGRFLLERSGFDEVEVLWLAPYPESSRIREDSEAAQRFNELMYGPREYVLIARRP